jgi:hypothetical protein
MSWQRTCTMCLLLRRTTVISLMDVLLRTAAKSGGSSFSYPATASYCSRWPIVFSAMLRRGSRVDPTSPRYLHSHSHSLPVCCQVRMLALTACGRAAGSAKAVHITASTWQDVRRDG